MRYQNWDVLLFPVESKVPMQEFDTKCFALDQNVRRSILQPGFDGDPINFESMTLVPTMTCFIPSLEPKTPFRISVHSWQKPTASQILQTYKTDQEKVAFEARVYIDGLLHAQRVFDSDSLWPEVIEDANMNRQGGQLLFPQFHRSITQQPHWEPSDLIGRIKLVITEGVIREIDVVETATAGIDRLRDIASFSFQHAPLSVLQVSGIAWPNVRMFARNAKQSIRTISISSRVPTSPIPNHDLHAHSPSKPSETRADLRPSTNSYENLRRMLNSQTSSGLRSTQRATTNTVGKDDSPFHVVFPPMNSTGSEDPFIGPQPIATRAMRAGIRRNSQDISMPDYGIGRAEHNRSHTSMSGVDYPRDDFVKHMVQANPREIVQALSPAQQEQLMRELWMERTPELGTHAPTNSPRSISVTSCTQLPIGRIRERLSKVDSGTAYPFQRTGDLSNVSGRGTDTADQTPSDGSAYARKVVRDEGVDVTAPLSQKPDAVEFTGPGDGTKCLSVSPSRSRSLSNMSKRKRSSNSVGIEHDEAGGRGPGTTGSSSSEGGSTANTSKSTATDGGVSV